MTSISLPDETFDITVTRTLTNLQTNEVKKNENNQFVFVPSTSVFDYLDACNRFYNLSFRIVRFKIADDKYETLVTNLDENEFWMKPFQHLYHLDGMNKLHSISSQTCSWVALFPLLKKTAYTAGNICINFIL